MEVGAHDVVGAAERLLRRRPSAVAVGVALHADFARVAIIGDEGAADPLVSEPAAQDLVEVAGALGVAWLNELPPSLREPIGKAIAAGAVMHVIAQRDRTLFLMLERAGQMVEIARCHLSILH